MIATTQNAIACIIENDKLLLYRRINTDYEPNKLGFVGGKIEPGETPTSAVIREIAEETSLVVNESDIELLVSLPTEHKSLEYMTHVYLVQKWTGTAQNLEPQKCGGLEWHPIDNLPDDVIPVIHDIVTHIP